jgi:hypothetical protein
MHVTKEVLAILGIHGNFTRQSLDCAANIGCSSMHGIDTRPQQCIATCMSTIQLQRHEHKQDWMVVGTHSPSLKDGPMEFSEKRYLELSAGMIGAIIALQDLVQSLKEKCPEADHWTEVAKAVRDIGCVMMVGPDNVFPVQLQRLWSGTAGYHVEEDTHVDQLDAVAAYQLLGFINVRVGDRVS